METWFISERKKPADPEVPTTAAPTNNASELVRKATSVYSFHSAPPPKLVVGPWPSGTAEKFVLLQLDQGTTTKPVSTISASPTDAIPDRAIIQTVLIDSVTVPLFTKGDLGWEWFILDSRMLDWRWSISSDTEHITAVLRFIPEIIWYSDVGKLLSIGIHYDTTLSSFDFTRELRVLIQSFKDRALAATKALVHLRIQKKCLAGEDVAKSEDAEKLNDGPRLASPAGFIPAKRGIWSPHLVFWTNRGSVRWESYKLTSAHHQWLAYILLP